MNIAFITTDHLSFGFPNNNVKVLNDINLTVEKGSIYGFLGPNGAGKTTTIRLLLGLLPTNKSNIQIFGKPLQKNQMEIFSKIGAFIESPSLYEHLTGYDNVEITRKIKNIPGSRIAEVLEEVNLSKDSNIKVKKYSLGMKQRLGLATALLSRPELLILDEPTNGLDPNGINEIRELLIKLNKQNGTTIFISSHLLTEVEKMATHLGIIHKGHLVFQGKMQDLIADNTAGNTLLIQTDNNKKAKEILQVVYNVESNRNGMLEIQLENNAQTDQVNKLLLKNEIMVFQLQNIRHDLEKIYLSITQK
ncbi:MAG: ABC transporter ATP-binding protein [Segetibacter sp.]